MTFKDLKVMFEATIGRKSAYTEKDRAKLEKSTYEILSGSLEGTPRVAHDESSSDDEEGGIGRREEEEKEIVEASMGLRFQQAVTLDDFLDGYNTQVNLPPKRVLALTSAEKSKRSSYINYWKPFARIFRDALSDFETLFGDKAGEYIGESELAMEEALVLSAGTLGQIESKQTSEQKRWKPVASAFISASAETRETMRTSWNLKGIMNQMHQEKFKAKKNSQQISEEDKKWVQKFTCPRCKTTINPKMKTAFTSKNQVTGHMTHCKKVPEQQQTRPKAAPGKSEKKRTVDMRAEEEEKEAENKKKAIRVIDDMLKKKQKSTSTQIPKRSSTLLDVVMRKEIPPVKTIVNGGPLPVIPKLTVSSTAMDPPPPRYVQQQKQTQQTQQTQQKADENKHLDDFRIEMPFGFVAPERAEPCLLIKTNARNVTERELNNLFRFFEGFQHVTGVQFREKENAAYAKSKTDKFILDSKDPINSVLNIGYFAGYTPPSSATARDAHKATTTHPSASADNSLSAAAKLAEPPDGLYCDLCEVKFAGKHHNDAVIENNWNQHAKTNCHQQSLKSKKIEGAEYFRPKIKRHPVTGSIQLIWICDCCQVTTGLYGNALWSGHAFGMKHAEAMREKSLSANATRSSVETESPSKTPTARNTPVSGQLGESESKSDWLQFKEVVKNKPARNTRSCPHYDPRTNKCGWANSFKNRGRTACRYCRNDSSSSSDSSDSNSIKKEKKGKKKGNNENGKRNGKVIEAKRIGKIIFRNDDIDIDEHKGYTKSDENDNDNANDAEVYFVTFRLKACSHHVPFSVSVVDSKGRKREFDDILFVSVAREAIDATANNNNAHKSDNSRRSQHTEDKRMGLDAIVKVLSLSSLASYERQQKKARKSKKGTSNNAFLTSISSAFLSPVHKVLDEYEFVPYFSGSGKGNSSWKDGKLKRKPISGVSISSRLLATRVAILLRRREYQAPLLKSIVAFAFDVFFARACFARIASWVQMMSSGFINGDYLIRNAIWLAKGDPLGVKLHLPLSRTLSGLAVVLAEGYASVLGVRFDTIVRNIDERLWFLGLTTQLAFLSDCMFLFTSHAAALHVYSSLLITAQVAFGKFCYEAGFGRPLQRRKEEEHTTKRQSTESLVFGVLFVPPIFLFFPTTFAFFASYLVLHAAALLVRAMVVFLVSSLESTKRAQKLVLVQQHRGKRFLRKYCKHVVQFWWGFSFEKNNIGFMGSCVNALRCFGRLPVASLKPFFEV
ncbi:unnamed protein product [Bathycoccus prasinos]